MKLKSRTAGAAVDAGAWLCIFSLALLLIPTPSSAAARSVSEIQAECDAGECPSGPYCFGFLTTDAKIHNEGRDAAPDADSCFNKPSPSSCASKPWAAVSKVGASVFKIALIGPKKEGVGIILFENGDVADPRKAARLVAVCEKGTNQVKIWASGRGSGEGNWSGREAEAMVKATKSESGDGEVFEFELDAGADAYKNSKFDTESYRIALFEGGIPPAADKITSSGDKLAFFTKLTTPTAKPGSKPGESGAAGVRVDGGAALAAFFAVFVILL